MANAAAKSAGIVIIGDEILSGKFADENAHFLIGQLRPLGVSLRRVAIIPDEIDEIGETVRSFSSRFDYVFTSGGVGPTHDDVTMAGIARGFSTRVTHHPELEAMIREHMGERMTDTHLRFAEVPEGAELVFGEGAIWPVVAYQNVYILPGVPSIFRRKFQSIAKQFRGQPFLLGRLYCKGDESSLAHYLNEIVERYPDVKLGSYPRDDSEAFKVIITVESLDRERALAAFEALRERLGSLVHDCEPPSAPAA
jgi:FAD synthetase